MAKDDFDVRVALRSFLRPSINMLPGKYYGRIAPAHIAVNFLVGLLGKGNYRDEIVELLSGDAKLPAFSKQIAAPVNEYKIQEFSKSLGVILNSDKRYFGKSFMSLFPISGDFLSTDASDDGFGKALLALMTSDQRLTLANEFAAVLDITKRKDRISKFIEHLSGNYVDETRLEHEQAKEKSTGEHPSSNIDEGSPFGDVVFSLLMTGFRKVNVSDFESKVSFIRKTSAMLTALTVLGHLFEGNWNRNATSAQADDSRGVGPIINVVVYTPVPLPEETQSQLMRLAKVSLLHSAIGAVDGVAEFFETMVRNATSNGAKTAEDIADLGGSNLDSAQYKNLIKSFEEFDVLNNPKALIHSSLGPKELVSAIRYLGSKVGLVGPFSGGSQRRIHFETRMLDALVFFVCDKPMIFQDFVNAVYAKLGLIVGLPNTPAFKDEGLKKLLACSEGSIGIDESLRTSHKEMQQRLVIAGLAQRFSDGNTIVGSK